MNQDEAHGMMKWRERQRFRMADPGPGAKLDGFKGMTAGPPQSPGFGDGFAPAAESSSRPRRVRIAMDDDEQALPPLPEDFVAPGRWGMVVAGAWREPAKIHDYEARAGRGHGPEEVGARPARARLRVALDGRQPECSVRLQEGASGGEAPS